MRASPANRTINSLRQQAERQYRDTLAAIERVERYLLNGDEASAASKGIASQLRRIEAQLLSDRSYREIVLECILDEPRSVREISEITGLEFTKVRGVLYAKPYEKVISRSRDDQSGVTRFRCPIHCFEKEFGPRKKSPPAAAV
jgi:hypothetical protein